MKKLLCAMITKKHSMKKEAFALSLFVKYFIIILLFTIPMESFCQSGEIKGFITDQNQQPVDKAVIMIKNVKGAAILSQADGSFSVKVNNMKNDTLIVSHVSFATAYVPVNDQNALHIQLIPRSKDLNDVVVISALGLTKKLNAVTYAQQSVNVGEMTEARDINITNMLAGKVAGLQVTTTGQPGSSTRVVIRGESSLTGNNQPLWVVDGVPIANDMGDQGGNDLDYGNGASDLNPDDIESIEVLKGPNAAALYGSQAANGAILVTTKKGKSNKGNLGVSINQNDMLYTVTEFPAYQNIYGEGAFSRLVGNVSQIIDSVGAPRMGNYVSSWGAPMLGQPYLLFNGQLSKYVPQPNNVKAIYQNSLTNISNISITNGDANASYRLSYTFTGANDVIKNQNINKTHNVNFTATKKIGNILNLSTNLIYTHVGTKNRTTRFLNKASPMSLNIYLPRSAQVAGFIPWVDSTTGNAINLGGFSSAENPFWDIYENSNEDKHDRFIGSVMATVSILKGLSFRTRANIDYEYQNSYQYYEKGGIYSLNGSYDERNYQRQIWNYEAMLLYNTNLNKDFTITANAATNYFYNDWSWHRATVTQLLQHNMPSIFNSNSNPILRDSIIQEKRFSVYGSATLGYKNYLFLDMTARNDWSSTLPPDNNSYFYPSVGGSFVFSNLLKKKKILNYGKLRISYAGVGNTAQPYALQGVYNNVGQFLGNPTIVYTNLLKNANLKPEHTNSLELGVDLNFLKDRISFNGSVYKSNTTNQIILSQSLPETGFNAHFLNAGDIQNKGIELTLDVIPIRTNSFNWDLTMNWSKNVNKVKTLTPGIDRIRLGGIGGISVNAVKGQPYGTLMGNIPYMVGDTTIVLPNGRLYYDADQIVGCFQPNWLGSIGSNFKYKNFDFSFLVTFKWGGQLYSNTMAQAYASGVSIASLAGRDDYFFSNTILGETGNERGGIGITVGNIITNYEDGRAKGFKYPLSYFPLTDQNGNIIYDENGRMIPGKQNNSWAEPQAIASDYIINNVKASIYDATSVKLSQLILGYTFPVTWIKGTFIKGVRLAFTGRNLWQIYKRTPQGIDPEAALSTANWQGIEAGGSYPYAQYGFDLKVNF